MFGTWRFILIPFLLHQGSGGGMSSNVTPMMKTEMGSKGTMGGMGGSYAGATDMTKNGLSGNQNQVKQINIRCI